MLHRPPGAAAGQGGPADVEEGFRPASGWLAEEAAPSEPGAPRGASFTRVVVGDLKPDVLGALADPEGALGVLRDLAHLYHYYIHGPGGNAFMWAPPLGGWERGLGCFGPFQSQRAPEVWLRRSVAGPERLPGLGLCAWGFAVPRRRAEP